METFFHVGSYVLCKFNHKEVHRTKYTYQRRSCDLIDLTALRVNDMQMAEVSGETVISPLSLFLYFQRAVSIQFGP
jgi:hypothetical protein